MENSLLLWKEEFVRKKMFTFVLILIKSSRQSENHQIDWLIGTHSHIDKFAHFCSCRSVFLKVIGNLSCALLPYHLSFTIYHVTRQHITRGKGSRRKTR